MDFSCEKTTGFFRKDAENLFANHPEQQEKLFKMYVEVGKVGAENFDDNLKTLYITSKIKLNKNGEYEHDNNTNRFLYHAGMMVVNNPDKNCGWNDETALCDKRNLVEYYVRLIQKVQTKQAEELMEEFSDEDFFIQSTGEHQATKISL